MLGFLEHHMLEQMGKACAPRDFAIGSHMVLNSYSRDGIGIILMNDDFQTIGQCVLLIIDFEFRFFWLAAKWNQKAKR